MRTTIYSNPSAGLANRQSTQLPMDSEHFRGPQQRIKNIYYFAIESGCEVLWYVCKVKVK